VNNGWLRSRPNPAGTEAMYSLTADAAQALLIVNELVTPPTAMTQSSVTSMMDQLTVLRVQTDPDYESRLDAAKAEVARAQQELERLETGGPDSVSVLDDNRAAEGLRAVIGWGRQAVADFTRTMTATEQVASDWHRAARTADRSSGDVISDLMEKLDQLETSEFMSSFNSFYNVLADPERHYRMQADIGTLLARPAAANLTADEVDTLDAMMTTMMRAARGVSDHWSDITRNLRELVENPKFEEERRIEKLGRQALAQYARLAKTRTGRSKLPYELPLSTTNPHSVSQLTLADEDRRRPEKAIFRREQRIAEMDELLALADKSDIDYGPLRESIATMLNDPLYPRSAVSIGSVLDRHPLEQGFAGLVGYLMLGLEGSKAEHKSAQMNMEALETVRFSDSRSAQIPLTIFYIPEDA
jgi:hypothetical protein